MDNNNNNTHNIGDDGPSFVPNEAVDEPSVATASVSAAAGSVATTTATDEQSILAQMDSAVQENLSETAARDEAVIRDAAVKQKIKMESISQRATHVSPAAVASLKTGRITSPSALGPNDRKHGIMSPTGKSTKDRVTPSRTARANARLHLSPPSVYSTTTATTTGASTISSISDSTQSTNTRPAYGNMKTAARTTRREDAKMGQYQNSNKGNNNLDQTELEDVSIATTATPPVRFAATQRDSEREAEEVAAAAMPNTPMSSTSNSATTPLVPNVAVGKSKHSTMSPPDSTYILDEEHPGAYRIPGRNTMANTEEFDDLAEPQNTDSPAAVNSINAHIDMGQAKLAQANPVVMDDLEDGERRKIQEQAEVDVKAKWTKTTIVAEPTDEYDERKNEAMAAEQEDKRRRDRRKLYIIITLILLCTVGIIVGLAVGLKDDGSDTKKGIIAPLTPAPISTPAPTQVTFPPTGAPTIDGRIDTCFGARNLTQGHADSGLWGIPNLVSGSTNGATEDEFLTTCGIIESNGRGVWYRLVVETDTAISASPSTSPSVSGTAANPGEASVASGRWLVSTCHEGTGYDSQVSVYKGECEVGFDPQLQCVAGNDQGGTGCDDRSRVAFIAEPDEEVYIYVHGFRNSQGIYELSVTPLGDNDKCEDALFVNRTVFNITAEDGSPPITRFGSTIGATVDDDPGISTTCDSQDIAITAPGVWYSMLGGGGEEVIIVEAERTTGFDAQITIFQGGSCSNLRCENTSSSGSIKFDSVKDLTYLILVHGVGNQEGDFSLVFDVDFPANDRTNSICNDAPELAIGETTQLNLEQFETPSPISCGDGVFVTGPGVWLKVVGKGTALQASTCSAKTGNTDTRLSVFKGETCEYLICVDGNDQDENCGEASGASSVTWFGEEGATYFILVHGTEAKAGLFELGITEAPINSADTCAEAPEVSDDGTTLIGAFFNSTLESVDVPKCEGIFKEWPGVWYSVEGTGKELSASACDDQSDQEINIVVYSGTCDSLTCSNITVIPCGAQSSVTWPTEIGTPYFLLVQSPAEVARALQISPLEPSNVINPAKIFSFSVEPVVFNDLCMNSIGPLSADNSITFGSTSSATPDDDSSCPADLTSSKGRGIWYTVLGTGGLLTASTLSEYTTFGTTISVFDGGCVSAFCSNKAQATVYESGAAAVSWQSAENTLYHLHVAASSIDELGNFALRIATENDICESSAEIKMGETVSSSSDSALFATSDEDVPSCNVSIETPAVWYRIASVRARVDMFASVEHAERNGASRIAVYGGNCGSLECVDFNTREESSTGATLSWKPLENTTYFVAVSGPSLHPYSLTVDRNGASCRGPIFVDDKFGQPVPVLVDTDSAIEDTVCRSVGTAPGKWFQFQGTGHTMEVSLACGTGPFFIAVMTGACGSASQQCIQQASFTECDGVPFTVQFATVPRETYRVLIQSEGDTIITVSFEEVPNETCDLARSLEGEISGNRLKIDGSFTTIFNEGFDFCGSAVNYGGFGDGSGAWYTFKGTGGLMYAATCFDETTSDTQITVYKGACSSQQCVTGNNNIGPVEPVNFAVGSPVDVQLRLNTTDDICSEKILSLPYTSSVSWSSDVDETYHVLVHGTESRTTGNFTLSIGEDRVWNNDECDNKLHLSGKGVPATSTLRFATTADAAERPPSCLDDDQANGRDLWFSFTGTGKVTYISTCSPITTFFPYMGVYVGSCGSHECAPVQDVQGCDGNTIGQTMVLSTFAEQIYDIRIASYSDNEFGSFVLDIITENDECSAATFFRFTPTATYKIGSTVNAKAPDFNACTDSTNSDAGVWYSVTGRGDELVASTCHNDTEIDTSIHVFTGGCDSGLNCVKETIIDDCEGGGQSVRWVAERFQTYLILVSGGPGTFGLSVDEPVPEPGPSETCQTAVALPLSTDQISVALASFPVSDASPCEVYSSVVGAWYVVKGTGLGISITGFCTEFRTAVSVFRGGCSTAEQECVAVVANADFCFKFFETTFLSEAGVDYYVLVHSDSTSYSGVAQFGVQEYLNDNCFDSFGPYSMPSDADLQLQGSITADSGRTQRGGDCGRAVNTNFAVWYTVMGNGNTFQATTCNEGTDFDTQISVYSGSCFTLECLAGNNDMSFDATGLSVCNAPDETASLHSQVTWATDSGVEYRVAVQGGVPGTDFPFGSFNLIISEVELLN